MSAASIPTDTSARDALTHLRLLLRANGYSPVPADGKAVYLPGWQTAAQHADEAEYRRWRTTFGYEVDGKTKTYRGDRHTNTGLLCGDLVGVDIDVPVPELAARLEALAVAMLGETPLRRIGRAPKVLRAYRPEVSLPKIATPELFLPDGTKVQIEILGRGQQFVAYGIHPDTGQDYEWPESGPDVVPLAELAPVTEAALRGFVAAAEAMLRTAGGRTQKERDAATGKTADGPAEPARPRPSPASRRPPADHRAAQAGTASSRR